jgi:hypothetical protein
MTTIILRANDNDYNLKLELKLSDIIDENYNVLAPLISKYRMNVVFNYNGKDYYKLNLKKNDINKIKIAFNFGPDRKINLSYDSIESNLFESLILQDSFDGIILSKNLLDVNNVKIIHAFPSLEFVIKFREVIVEKKTAIESNFYKPNIVKKQSKKNNLLISLKNKEEARRAAIENISKI